MRFPLTVLSLALIAALLLWQLSILFARTNPRRFGSQAAAPETGFQQTMVNICKDAMVLYLPFAAVALMMISFGKPGLLPQYAGWAIVALQILRSASVAFAMPRMRTVLGLLALICLTYLWVLQLPYFDPFPA